MGETHAHLTTRSVNLTEKRDNVLFITPASTSPSSACILSSASPGISVCHCAKDLSPSFTGNLDNDNFRNWELQDKKKSPVKQVFVELVVYIWHTSGGLP